jgi:hypothetical protein
MKPTENLSQDTAAVVDSLSVMIQKERAAMYKCTGYLDPYEPTIITADDRMKVVDWCYGVVDHCQLSREVVAAAMDMVDRYLSMPSCTTDEALRDQNKFQLLTITALYVAIKVNERVAVSSELFAEMSRDAYTAKEIEDMELTLLSGLSWRCNAPTAFQVGHFTLSMILPYTKCSEMTWGFLLDEIKYLTEHAVRDYYFSTQRASTIALATIFNAIGDINISDHERQQLLEAFLCIVECFDFDDPKLVVAASKRLHRLLQQENYDDDITEETMEMKVPEASSKYPEMSSVNSRSRMRQSLRHYLKELELHGQDDQKKSPRLVAQHSSSYVSVCGKAA